MASNPSMAASVPSPVLLPPATSLDQPSFSFSLSASASALDQGLVCERSDDLSTWATVWSYQADPLFTVPSVTQVESFASSFTLHLSDVEAAIQRQLFYRVRSGF